MRDLAALGLDLLLRVLELLGGSLGLEGDLCIVSTIPSFFNTINVRCMWQASWNTVLCLGSVRVRGMFSC